MTDGGRAADAALREEIARYQALGIEWLCVGFAAPTRAAFRAEAERFADRIIAKLPSPR
jgi:hypothetical protein